MPLLVLWLSSLQMDSVTQVRIFNEAVSISHSTNTPVKDTNPVILPPGIVK